VANARLTITGAGFPASNITINGQDVTSNIISMTSSQIVLTLPNIDLLGQTSLTSTVIITGLNKETKQPEAFPMSFTLYDPDVNLESITPTKVYVGNDTNVITLKGQKLFSYSSIQCVFGDSTLGYVYSTFNYVNSTSGTCVAPVVMQSRNSGLQVNLLYGDDPLTTLFVPTSATGDRQLKYFEKAPEIGSISFSSTGAFVYLTFTKAVNYSPDSNFDLATGGSCNLFLMQNSSSGKQLWNSANDCKANFLSPTRMQISISSRFIRDNSALVPGVGDVISLADNVLTTRLAYYSDFSSGSGTIRAPELSIVPSIVIVAPKKIDGCPDLMFDLSQTLGSGGRPFTTGAFSVSSNDANDSGELEKLNTLLGQKLSAILTNSNPNVNPFVFSLGKADVPSGQLEFNFSLTNFLGGSSSQSVTVEKDASKHIPYILFSPPSSMKPDALNSLDLSVGYPCGDVYGKVVNNWISLDSKRSISSKDATKRSLIFPPYTLDAGNTYSFRVATSYENFPDEVYSYDATIQVSSGELSVSIGNGLTVGTAGTLRMQATISDSGYSVANVKANPQRYNTEWTCETTDDNGGTVDCLDSTTQSKLVIPNGPTLELSRVLFKGSYSFSAYVTNKLTGAGKDSGTVLVTIVDGAVPSIRIVASDRNPTSWSNFALNTLISDTVSPAKDLSIVWQSLAMCDGTEYTVIDLTSPGVLLSSGRSLKFTPGALNSGSQYCFQAMVIDPKMTRSGSSTITIAIRERPSVGYCDILGANSGIEFSDKFVFTCTKWQTDSASYPLYYAWDMKKDGESQWTSLFTPDLNPTFETSLPQGTFSVRATIIDAAGAINEEAQIITVTVEKNSDPNAKINFAEETKTNFESSGNPKEAMRSVALLGSSGSSDSSTSKRKRQADTALKAVVLEFMSVIMDSGTMIIEPRGSGPQMLSTLGNIAGTNASLSPQLQGSIFEILERNINELSDNGLDSNECYKAEDAQKAITVLNTLISSASALSANDTLLSRAYDTLRVLEGCMIRTQSCGQTPFSADTSSLNRSVGVLDASTASSACNFGLSNVDTMLSSSLDEFGCVAFRCGVNNASAFIASQNNSIGSLVADLTFHDSSSTEINVKDSLSNITVRIPLTEDYIGKFNLSGYDFSGNNEWENHQVAPECSYFNGTLGDDSGKWETNGCTPIAITATELVCTCNHLTSFGVKVVKVIQPPTTSSSGTSPSASASAIPGEGAESSTSTGPIIGAVAGGVVVAAVLAVTGARRRRTRKAAKSKDGNQKETMQVLPPSVLKDIEPIERENSIKSKASAASEVDMSPQGKDVESSDEEVEPEEFVPAPVTNTTKKMTLPPVPVENQRIARILANLPAYSLPPSYEEHMRARGIDIKAQRPVKQATLAANGTELSNDNLYEENEHGSFDTINTVDESQSIQSAHQR
jgi:hypothetical protein